MATETPSNPLPGTVQLAAPGSVVVDTGSPVTPQIAAQLKAAGVAGVARYVDLRPNVPEPGTIRGVLMTREEAGDILEAGLALMPVQKGMGTLTSSTGARTGAAAASNARALGFGEGCTLWCDVESTGGDSPDNIIAYCGAWWREVTEAGYHPGIYVGTKRLTGDQLYQRLKFTTYWASAMNINDPLPRGYSMFQTRAREMFGIAVDVNALISDQLEGLPSWQVIAPEC